MRSLLCLAVAAMLLPDLLPAQPAATNAPLPPHLRIWCAHSGNVAPKLFGEWPTFQPGLQLFFTGGTAGEQALSSGLLPLSTQGYVPVTPGPAKVSLRETPPPEAKIAGRVRAEVPFAPKTGKFYTLVILSKGSDFALEIIEDLPAVLPPAKPGEESPPPQRSLRCLVFTPDTYVQVTCPEAGIKSLQGSTGKTNVAPNVKKGIWALAIQGKAGDKAFQNMVELDLDAPGNWTLFLMENIYGQVATYLQKDASLD